MAAIPSLADPTLEAADHAMEVVSARGPRRTYLGMSAIGGDCSRKLWYDLQGKSGAAFDAATLYRFADGHSSEAVMASRLRLVPGVTLLTVDPENGRQFGFSDFDGRFRGHMDGAILGILQAPQTWHVWEGKCVNEKKFGELGKLKAEGEKEALKAWDTTYYAQAVLYMDYSGMDRHYLTVCTPGARMWMGVRTNADPVAVVALKKKAQRILEAKVPPSRVSNDPAWFQCKFCQHAEACHAG